MDTFTSKLVKSLVVGFLFYYGNTLNAETVVSIDRTVDKDKYVNVSDDIPPAWYLVFMADGGSITGHAYVTWGMENPDTLSSEQYCFGLYAKGNDTKQIIFGSVDGEFRDGDCWSILNTTHRLIMKVDKLAYEKAKKVYDRWRLQEKNGALKYELRNKDCVTFLIEVANAAGLETPDRGIAFPQDYIEKLIEVNQEN